MEEPSTTNSYSTNSEKLELQQIVQPVNEPVSNDIEIIQVVQSPPPAVIYNDSIEQEPVSNAIEIIQIVQSIQPPPTIIHHYHNIQQPPPNGNDNSIDTVKVQSVQSVQSEQTITSIANDGIQQQIRQSIQSQSPQTIISNVQYVNQFGQPVQSVISNDGIQQPVSNAIQQHRPSNVQYVNQFGQPIQSEQTVISHDGSQQQFNQSIQSIQSIQSQSPSTVISTASIQQQPQTQTVQVQYVNQFGQPIEPPSQTVISINGETDTNNAGRKSTIGEDALEERSRRETIFNFFGILISIFALVLDVMEIVTPVNISAFTNDALSAVSFISIKLFLLILSVISFFINIVDYKTGDCQCLRNSMMIIVCLWWSKYCCFNFYEKFSTKLLMGLNMIIWIILFIAACIEYFSSEEKKFSGGFSDDAQETLFLIELASVIASALGLVIAVVSVVFKVAGKVIGCCCKVICGILCCVFCVIIVIVIAGVIIAAGSSTAQ